MWETIRGYLTFTRKERYGVLFLLILISILFVAPYFFRPSVGDPDPGSYEKMKDGIQQAEIRMADSSGESDKHGRYQKGELDEPADNSGGTNSLSSPETFYFDPNRIKLNDWQRLGLSARVAQTIMHYREKGGRFYKAEDLKKVYLLHPADYERLFPWVRFALSTENIQPRSGYYPKSVYPVKGLKNADSFFRETPVHPDVGFTWSAKRFEITDINGADSAGWSRLPGIGTKLASRIVHFREKLGGFYAVSQVGETFGLADSVFQKIKPFLRLTTITLNQIDLNTAAGEMLRSHPYIRWQTANGIINYRLQHGRFQSVDELLQLAQMDPQKFEKLKPYLVVNP
jgi:competence protein ComEA